MSGDLLAVGTYKGLLTFERSNGDWKFVREAFVSIEVSYAAIDPRSNTLYACLDHGHWGNKLHRSHDEGRTWKEIETPKYPAGATLSKGGSEEAPSSKGKPAVLKYMWSFAHGGDDQLGRVYIGTEPGGLFVSDDAGDTFQIVESLWDHPSRNEFWMGGGRDEPGIHSILVDPRGSNRMITGISCAGVFVTDDGGQTWEPRNRGLRADFLPNPEAEIGHDPHLVVQCAAQPDVLWQQNHCGIFRSTDLGQNWTDVSDSDGVAKFGFCRRPDSGP